MTAEDFRTARARLGMTARALARELGVNIRTIYKWERGEYPVPRVVELAVERLAQTASKS